MMTKVRNLLLCSLLALTVSACATSPTGRSQFILVSPESAIAQSRVAYENQVQAFRRDGALLHDPALSRRIERITGRLVTESVRLYPHTARWKWSVALIDDPETINAWCMAGGRMAIYSGIVFKLDLSDDEIAHIMGHEIAHALANHAAERMSMAMAQGLAVLAIQLGTESRQAGEVADSVANVALTLPNSRTAELEADEIGMMLAVRAGYEPLAAVSLWRKMSSQGGARPPEFLSTHPSPGNRATRLAALAREVRGLAPARAPEVFPVRMYP
ncbi:MAG: M48 family metallopeptidase [Gammaproteobacteria bacterium]|nr:M48 family metallopeptidase [Gammaproteobacteria bacterium]